MSFVEGVKSLGSYGAGLGVGLLGVAKFMETSLYQHSTLEQGALVGISGTAWFTFLAGAIGAFCLSAYNIDEGVTYDSVGKKIGMRAAYGLLGVATTVGFIVANAVGRIALP